jgi:uncharacterized protein (DUF1810 family)
MSVAYTGYSILTGYHDNCTGAFTSASGHQTTSLIPIVPSSKLVIPNFSIYPYHNITLYSSNSTSSFLRSYTVSGATGWDNCASGIITSASQIPDLVNLTGATHFTVFHYSAQDGQTGVSPLDIRYELITAEPTEAYTGYSHVTGYYDNCTGALVTAANHQATTLIPIVQGSKLYIPNFVINAYHNIVLYSSNSTSSRLRSYTVSGDSSWNSCASGFITSPGIIPDLVDLTGATHFGVFHYTGQGGTTPLDIRYSVSSSSLENAYLGANKLSSIYLGSTEILKAYRGTELFWNKVEETIYIQATGGTIQTYSSGGKFYKSHTFTSVGNNTFTVTQLSNDSTKNVLDYLIIGGGGGGGSWYYGGGGGAGGYLTTLTPTPGNTTPKPKITPSLTNYTITVGGGGAQNQNGQNSSAFGQTAIGGGRGGQDNTNGGGQAGFSGGSGGGGSTGWGYTTNNAGGSATSGQGFNGGTGTLHAGGGGGAGQAGRNGIQDATKGVGGDGLPSKIRTGVDEYRAGGGAGSIDANYPPSGSPTRVQGGLGGGGYSAGSTSTSGGWNRTPRTSAAPGQLNTGSGGGAGLHNAHSEFTSGGAGGSGIVIIRYEVGGV